MQQLPLWAQLLQFIATIVVTIFAAYIVYGQWRTAHERVVLDLFERRITVYESVRTVIAEIMRDGTADGGTVFRTVAPTVGLPAPYAKVRPA